MTNFMNAGLDHGGYWANDEGFLVPLVRHLDDPRGDGSASRFYRSRLGRAVRIGGLDGLVIAASGPEIAVLLGWFVVVALFALVVRES